MVNLLIAQILPHDQTKYAEECLDLLDILQQDNNGDVSDDVKNIISIAEDLIEELEIKQQEGTAAAASDTGRAVIDPAIGFFSDSQTSPSSKGQQDSANKTTGDDTEMKDIVGKGSGEVLSSDKSSSENDASVRGSSEKSDSEKTARKDDGGDKKGRIIYVYKTDKNDKDDVVADRNNTVAIEGMLRDSSDKPRDKKTTAMPSCMEFSSLGITELT
jgi:hypothetical protein